MNMYVGDNLEQETYTSGFLEKQHEYVGDILEQELWIPGNVDLETYVH